MKTGTGSKFIPMLDLRIFRPKRQNQKTTLEIKIDLALWEEEGVGRAQQQTNKRFTNPLEISVDKTCQNSNKT